MSSETLSQSEIDALFSGGETPTRTAVSRDRGDEVQLYDFRRPNLISKDRLRALDAMYGMLCKSLENWLTTRVRGAIEVKLLGIEHFSFGEFMLSLPSPTSSYVFDAKAGGPQVVIDFGRDFAFYLVDRLLGSSGVPPMPDRALTVLERMIVRIASEYVANQLDEIWKEHVTLGLTLNRFESVPEILRTANREDPMLVAHIEVKARNLNGTLLLCVPLNTLEKFFMASNTQRVYSARGRSNVRDPDRIAAESTLRSTGVLVTVRTPQFMVALRDVAALQPGRTLITGLPAAVTLPVMVEDQVKFLALPGRAGRTLAVRITEVIEDGAEQRAEMITRSSAMASIGGNEEGGIDLAELENKAGAAAAQLNTLFSVTLPVSIELGRARMSVQEVLELSRGSVIPLERLVGEPVDVIIGDRRFAEGEVVVIGEQFGVRITRIIAVQNGVESES